MTDDDLSYLPPGEQGVTPYLCIRGAAEAIDFYVDVFGAVESGERFVDPEGKVGHAELVLSGSRFYLAEEMPGYGKSPIDLEDVPVAIYAHVKDVDAVTEKAKKAGATILVGPEDTFYGARRTTLRDPFGHRWMVVTHTREVSQDEYDAAREGYAETGNEP